MNKNAKKSNLLKNLFIILFMILILGCSLFLIYKNKVYDNKLINKKDIEQAKMISEYFNKYVKTNKASDLYILIDNNYQKIGEIKKDEELILSPGAISNNTQYFKIKSLENTYYIHYKNVSKIEELSVSYDRYKKYIPFNKNIVTDNNTKFYSEEGELIYTIYKSFELPIIIIDEDRYGVEFNDRLLYIKKENVISEKECLNSDDANAKGIAVLNYHFFYDENDIKSKKECNQSICLSKSNFLKHLEYIKNNNIFTPTALELEMYIDGKIQLPKSVVITIDDGWSTDIGISLLNKYKMNAIVFLITSWFEKIDFLNDSKYIEYHSHGDNLHTVGVCPGGQGGGIKCIKRNELLNDLKKSSVKLGGSKYFCYPFYEYNNYSIEVLKEAGYTMAFGGQMEGGISKVSPGVDKFRLPRYVIYRNTSVDNIKKYIE